ncbi:flagellar assembly peptidoglycan hydrolase FlgJ [Salinicola sp. DM10]|uniref:flagellar assembly peptidoglycan hydrolase FlgJ n=1 Tax=Salinicola sp. DM10 TaxID=2815721 RepID=UPI001A8E20E4|nr:flagellar assembly peptidoglycan hydrolase FlgJ [Salinicola sp. DM10]MCE3025820.1 flagellar assembly peptidoglycan hydrolase FlgJ [Salinicola sp. DM10]
MTGNDLSSQFALDVQGIQKLKYSAGHSPQGSLKEAAKQFEAVFLQMMLKSMREATPKSDLLHSQQGDMLQSMQDQQWSQQLAGKGFGLAEQLVTQLERSGLPGTQPVQSQQEDIGKLIAGIPRGIPTPLTNALRSPTAMVQQEGDVTPGEAAGQLATSAASLAGAATQFAGRAAHVADFLAKLAAPAKRAEQASGVPAELILAQAALETGWGKREIPTESGDNSHNLFGIKAGSAWQGKTTDIATTEYVNGRPIQTVDRFRVYDSYADAFADYAALIGDNPRYSNVVAATSPQQAAHAIQRAGYATDPNYADKLNRIIGQLGDLASVSAEPTLAAASDPYSLARAPTTLF